MWVWVVELCVRALSYADGRLIRDACKAAAAAGHWVTILSCPFSLRSQQCPCPNQQAPASKIAYRNAASSAFLTGPIGFWLPARAYAYFLLHSILNSCLHASCSSPMYVCNVCILFLQKIASLSILKKRFPRPQLIIAPFQARTTSASFLSDTPSAVALGPYGHGPARNISFFQLSIVHEVYI